MSDSYATTDASSGNYMMINGVRYPVINSWVEVECYDGSTRMIYSAQQLPPSGDGRMRWGIVTEAAEEQPAPPAHATACPEDCSGCQQCTVPAARRLVGTAATATGANCMVRGDNHEAHLWTLNGHAYQCDGTSATAAAARSLFRDSGPIV